MKQSIIALALCLLAGYSIAQSKLSIDNVYSIYLKNSGAIREGEQVKGYYLFYQSDKIDKHTNEYTLQILDQNLNKVKDIKFTDSKEVELLEASYNGSAMGFFFKNEETKTLDMKVYDMNGKSVAAYSIPLDKKAEARMNAYKMASKGESESTNKTIYDLSKVGFVSVVPIKDENKHFTYQVDVYFSSMKKQWSYTPQDDDEKYAQANYLGCTDSILVLEVIKKDRTFGGGATSNVVGINFYTRKKVFEIKPDASQDIFVPINMTSQKESGNLLLVGSYYEKGANIIKDFSKGIGVYIYNTSGQLISKANNSWIDDMSKFLNVSARGKVEDIGYLYFHDIIQTPDGKTFAVGEGYKRVADALGIASTALGVLARSGTSAGGNTKMKVTDMVLLELNPSYKVVKATTYEKNSNSYPTMFADMYSQHMIAMMMKADGAFDYEFTLSNSDHSNFAVCYSDYERSKDFKGQTFHSIRYNGTGFTTDQINLSSKATSMEVKPAKPGFVMIMEYYKKDKKLDMRLEKMN